MESSLQSKENQGDCTTDDNQETKEKLRLLDVIENEGLVGIPRNPIRYTFSSTLSLDKLKTSLRENKIVKTCCEVAGHFACLKFGTIDSLRNCINKIGEIIGDEERNNSEEQNKAFGMLTGIKNVLSSCNNFGIESEEGGLEEAESPFFYNENTPINEVCTVVLKNLENFEKQVSVSPTPIHNKEHANNSL